MGLALSPEVGHFRGLPGRALKAQTPGVSISPHLVLQLGVMQSRFALALRPPGGKEISPEPPRPARAALVEISLVSLDLLPFKAPTGGKKA